MQTLLRPHDETLGHVRFLGVGLGQAAQLLQVAISEHVQGLGIALVTRSHRLRYILAHGTSNSKASRPQRVLPWR